MQHCISPASGFIRTASTILTQQGCTLGQRDSNQDIRSARAVIMDKAGLLGISSRQSQNACHRTLLSQEERRKRTGQSALLCRSRFKGEEYVSSRNCTTAEVRGPTGLSHRSATAKFKWLSFVSHAVCNLTITIGTLEEQCVPLLSSVGCWGGPSLICCSLLSSSSSVISPEETMGRCS